MNINNPKTQLLVLTGLYIVSLLAASFIGALVLLATKDLALVLILNTLISFGGSVLAYHKIFDQTFVDRNLFQKPESWKWFFVAILLFLASIPLVEYFSKPETDQTILRLCVGASPLRIAALVIGVAILPSVFEEWFFRGIMQRNISRIVKNDYVAIVITAAVFSLMHFEFANFIPRFIIGFLLGLMFCYSKSLWVNIFIHFSNNLVVFIALMLQANKNIELAQESTFDNVLYIIPSLLVIAVVIFLYEKNRPTGLEF